MNGLGEKEERDERNDEAWSAFQHDYAFTKHGPQAVRPPRRWLLVVALLVAALAVMADARAGDCVCSTDTDCAERCGGNGDPDPEGFLPPADLGPCTDDDRAQYVKHGMDPAFCESDRASGASVHDWDGDTCAETDSGCPCALEEERVEETYEEVP